MIGRELDDLEAISRGAERSDRPHPARRSCKRHGRGPPRRARARGPRRATRARSSGIAGLLGSGRTELVRLLYGADRADAGQIEINGEPVKIASPRHAIEHRIAFSSEDRRGGGHRRRPHGRREHRPGHPGPSRLACARSAGPSGTPWSPSTWRPSACGRPTPTLLAGNLSGGNQQKVLLARWLATAPELLILDEPTRGIDVGAKADIQRKVAELSAARARRSSSSPPSSRRCFDWPSASW